MRYYDITLTNPDTGQVIKPSYFAALSGWNSTYSSFYNGQSLPNALNVEFDIPVAPYAQPRQGAWLRVWGISLAEMAQAGQLNFANITLKAGMQKGLPLANPAQAGIIMEGTVFQSFGNWRGVDMTLDMTLLPPAGTDNKPVNLTLNWQRGQPLGPALQQALHTAFPTYTVPTPAISAQLVAKTDQKSLPYTKLSEFASMIQKLTTDPQYTSSIVPIGGGTYSGVDIIILPGKKIVAYDGTVDFGQNTFSNPKVIGFQDLIGQPTWISPVSINFACILRSDIGVGDYVMLPDRLASPYVLTTAAAAFIGTPARNSSALKGVFRVIEMHHFANFRQADGDSWVTTYDAVFVPQS